ncbi:MAG: DUF4190 domain-containing protein [Gemmataceae bacterium]|nr:DUF4190 domain-containing protein [Gemmataceae bacterium]
MAEPDDKSGAFEEQPPAKPARAEGDEGIQPARPQPKPRPGQPPPDDWDDDDRDRPRRRGPRAPNVRREDDAVATIIPYRNGMALAAYYVGVFSLIPCIALILGPLGIIFGIIGLRRVNANPEVKGTGHAIAGIVLGSITSLANYGLLVLFFLGVLTGGRFR